MTLCTSQAFWNFEKLVEFPFNAVLSFSLRLVTTSCDMTVLNDKPCCIAILAAFLCWQVEDMKVCGGAWALLKSLCSPTCSRLAGWTPCQVSRRNTSSHGSSDSPRVLITGTTVTCMSTKFTFTSLHLYHRPHTPSTHTLYTFPPLCFFHCLVRDSPIYLSDNGPWTKALSCIMLRQATLWLHNAVRRQWGRTGQKWADTFPS